MEDLDTLTEFKDNRDLNYKKYFSEGCMKISTIEDYNSHNTYCLNVEETKKLLKLDYIKKELKLWSQK